MFRPFFYELILRSESILYAKITSREAAKNAKKKS